LLAALALFALQSGWSSTAKSAAFDEQYHLTAGYAYLRTGDPRLATNHPPLAGLLAALPLLGDAEIKLPTEHPAWQAGDRYLFSDIFLWESGNDAQSILVRSRLAITLLGVMLVASIYFAARQILGERAAWLALLLAVFEPNLIAHSRFVTTDLPLTLFFFLAVWWWWRWLANAEWHSAWLAGAFAGLAMGVKYNGGLVWAVIGLMTLIQPLAVGGAGWKKRLGGSLIAAATALGVLWILFRFAVGPVTFLPEWALLPAPHYWQWLWNTFDRIVNLQDVRVNFMLGETSRQGWWTYFFVAGLYKLPIVHLLLAFAGLMVIVWRREVRLLAVLWLPPALFLLMGATQILNIGFRHMLPAIPFLLLLGGSVAEHVPWLYARPRRVVVATSALLLWLAVDAFRISPHYESYFNQLAGPWQNWSQILVDSNLDWGQDLIALRQVMDERGIEAVNLAYFGKGVPEAYGVRYRPLPSYLRFMEGREITAYNPHTPEPGWYAISATALRTGVMTPEGVDLYEAFRSREPDGRAGYSIYLYNLTYPAATEVVRPVVLAEPLWQVAPGTLGITPETRAAVKWLETPESHIFPLGIGANAQESETFQHVGANFDNVLTLLGYTQNSPTLHPGGVLDLTLYWQVGEQPMPQPAPTRGAPISAFVHLVDGDPASKVAEFDSWNVALRGLEPGDIIAQHAILQISESAAPKFYDLLVGLYSPQNGQRLTTAQAGVQRDFAMAGLIEVTP
jgi:hypothetical protein